MAKTDLQMRLCPACLRQLNDAVCRSQKAMDAERDALSAGKALADGNVDAGLLVTVAKWKSPRRSALLAKNEPHTLKEALRIARDKLDVEQKMGALCKLHGVGPRMASAILTAMYPTQYLVIDVRALDTLGLGDRTNYEALYPEYLSYCLQQAAKAGMELREFDRAIWKAGTP